MKIVDMELSLIVGMSKKFSVPFLVFLVLANFFPTPGRLFFFLNMSPVWSVSAVEPSLALPIIANYHFTYPLLDWKIPSSTVAVTKLACYLSFPINAVGTMEIFYSHVHLKAAFLHLVSQIQIPQRPLNSLCFFLCGFCNYF